ncbi:hypothetical protein IHN63_00105 [Deinococcus sp. 6YEL10]|uniref:hypothetical protein n=1 Tax=Deinococcus sp. 6YEL10 TaxID=2745870 RepID=UPI001E62BEFB|nr:hypothetical protein [Deinococcus sp. 6YEL10]MCD0159700.1 hypothetical protein [Deinococcus sp. 6YEL10]
MSREETVQKHPAMGLVVISKTSHGGTGRASRGVPLFGSDLRHTETVSITVMESSVSRSLSNDWHHQGRRLLELRMSTAQWAQMVSSFGNGNGTPVTLEYITRDGPGRIEPYPDPPSKIEQFEQEVEASVASNTDRLKDVHAEIARLIGSGKAGKRDLEALHRNLGLAISANASSATFVVEQHKERMEQTVAEAKIEVEAYVTETLGRLGRRALLEQLQDRQGEPVLPGDGFDIEIG